jgi:hypothetical protein
MPMTWIYGVVLVVVGSIGNNLGNNLVSLGHKDHQEKTIAKCGDMSMNTEVSETGNSTKVEEKESCCSWCNIGRIVFVIGSLFTFASFAFGAQSLIASLESVQFVSNVFFVHYVHHEAITTRMLIATISIVVGNILVVIFAEHKAQTYTSDEMIYLYKTNYIYHGYMVIAFFAWALTAWIFEKYHHARMIKRELLWQHSFVEPFCYSVSSAIIGTQAVLNSKCLALLLDSTSRGEKEEFEFWYVYFILGTWLLLVSYWLARLDGGLALFPPMFIIPVMQVFFVFFAILCGGIYFQEFVHFTLVQYIGFIVGVSLILGGVYGLAPVDMKLYVPGDPAAPAPVKMVATCGGGHCVVHSEAVLTDKQRDLESAELDEQLQAILSLKPQPDQHPDINLFSAAVQPGGEDENIPPSFDAGNPASARAGGASKKNRRVVKRPLSVETVALPPVQVRGSAEHYNHATASGATPSGSPPREENAPAIELAAR